MQVLQPIGTQRNTIVFFALLGAIALLVFLLSRQNLSLPWEDSKPIWERSALQEVITTPSREDNGVEGYGEYLSALLAEARAAEVLEVGECRAVEPLVLQVRYGELVRIRNSADSVRTLILENGERHLIKPNSEEEILMNFYHEDGVYPYACDEWQRAGVFFVLPQGEGAAPANN